MNISHIPQKKDLYHVFLLLIHILFNIYLNIMACAINQLDIL